MTVELGRRSFLTGLAAAALTGVGAASSAAASGARVPLTYDERRVVIVGSGFGGGVTALRLAQAGVPSLVLERGIRWSTGPNADTFPRQFSPDRRSAWLSPVPVLTGSPPVVFRPYTGVLERVRGNGMDILCGAGVGGGSLVYHGMSLQPAEAVFNEVLPADLDYAEMDRVYYPRVARMLGLATIPDDVLASPSYLSSRIFIDHIEKAGMTPTRIPMPIDWEWARRELRGEMTPSYTNGDLIYGVNNGGKHSVDVTYLAKAEATGRVEIATLHQVTDIAMAGDGRWQVHVDRITTDGNVVEQKIITTAALFLTAGSAGTTRLLMKARAKGLVPDLPDAVGTRWGNNGDRIYAWMNLPQNTGAFQGGPACVGTKDWSDPSRALTIVHGPIPVPVESHIMSVIGYGVTAGRGHFTYDPVRDDAVLNWSRDADADLVKNIRAHLDAIVGANGGLLVDTTELDPTTYHPLGGAPIGEVCDSYGRVLGHRGLYVMDGALIPGSTGACNPSMTIAALAERNTDTVVAVDVGTVF